MRCPGCGSSDIQATTVFESKWFASYVIEQSLAFVCLDCGRQWRPPKPDTRVFQSSEDVKMGIGCFVVFVLVMALVAMCAG